MNNHMHDHESVIHCLLPLLPTLFLRSFLRPNFGAFGASHFTSGCQQLAILATFGHQLLVSTALLFQMPRGGKCFIVWKGDKQYDSTEYHRRCIYMGKNNYHHHLWVPPTSQHFLFLSRTTARFTSFTVPSWSTSTWSATLAICNWCVIARMAGILTVTPRRPELQTPVICPSTNGKMSRMNKTPRVTSQNRPGIKVYIQFERNMSKETGGWGLLICPQKPWFSTRGWNHIFGSTQWGCN